MELHGHAFEGDLEQELERLIGRYENAVAAADAARLEYHALRQSPLATAVALDRTRRQWKQLEHSRAALRRAIDLLENQGGV
jgi:hypothetical protein